MRYSRYSNKRHSLDWRRIGAFILPLLLVGCGGSIKLPDQRITTIVQCPVPSKLQCAEPIEISVEEHTIRDLPNLVIHNYKSAICNQKDAENIRESAKFCYQIQSSPDE